MHFQQVGIGDNIVFLHGWGCSGDIFLPVVERFNRFSCYLVDFRGFGKSALPPMDGWTVEDYADDLFKFFVDNHLSSATLVAHSFGCRVAVVFAAKYPSYVRKMILVAPAGVRKFNFIRSLKVCQYKISKFLRRIGLVQNVSKCYGSVDYAACGDGLKNTFVKVVNQDLRCYAKRITAPTLIICGRDDTETPLKDAKILNNCVKSSVLTEIAGGHFAFFVNPAAFSETVRLFEEA